MDRMRLLREEAGLSQHDLAVAAGLTASGLYQIESGRRAPKLRTAQAIARALSEALGRPVTPDDIWPPAPARAAAGQ